MEFCTFCTHGVLHLLHSWSFAPFAPIMYCKFCTHGVLHLLHPRCFAPFTRMVFYTFYTHGVFFSFCTHGVLPLLPPWCFAFFAPMVFCTFRTHGVLHLLYPLCNKYTTLYYVFIYICMGQKNPDKYRTVPSLDMKTQTRWSGRQKLLIDYTLIIIG